MISENNCNKIDLISFSSKVGETITWGNSQDLLQLDASDPWTLTEGLFNVITVLLSQLKSNLTVYLFNGDCTVIFFRVQDYGLCLSIGPTALASVEYSFSVFYNPLNYSTMEGSLCGQNRVVSLIRWRRLGHPLTDGWGAADLITTINT